MRRNTSAKPSSRSRRMRSPISCSLRPNSPSATSTAQEPLLLTLWNANRIGRNIASSRKRLNDVPDHNFSLSSALKKGAPLLLLMVIAAIWLYRTPYSASNLEVTPDAVEYALAPLQFLETGHYDIVVEGRPLPSRYPPCIPS